MTSEHVILCGGVSPPARCKGERLILDTGGREPNVTLKVNDITATMVADLPPVLADLLEIAAYVYSADQAITRGGIKSFDYGKRWRRSLRFHIPVRCVDLWSKPEVSNTLVDTLRFLGDDDDGYEFIFTANPSPLPAGTYFPFDRGAPNVTGIKEVCAFSGGLDSLAGAIQEIIVDNRKVALVSHRSVSKRFSTQKFLADQLTEASQPDYRPLPVPVWAFKDQALTHDYRQRTRSFLYASLAAVIAGMFKLDRIRFYENGPVSLNLPICEQVLGARATRTTHPRTLRGFETLFGLLLNRTFTVENPFRWKTKAEVFAIIKKANQTHLIEHAISCMHTYSLSKEHTHCGGCSQCIDRRFAALASGCAKHDPAANYKVDLLTGTREKPQDQTMLERYVGTATKIEKIAEPA